MKICVRLIQQWKLCIFQRLIQRRLKILFTTNTPNYTRRLNCHLTHKYFNTQSVFSFDKIITPQISFPRNSSSPFLFFEREQVSRTTRPRIHRDTAITNPPFPLPSPNVKLSSFKLGMKRSLPRAKGRARTSEERIPGRKKKERRQREREKTRGSDPFVIRAQPAARPSSPPPLSPYSSQLSTRPTFFRRMLNRWRAGRWFRGV